MSYSLPLASLIIGVVDGLGAESEMGIQLRA